MHFIRAILRDRRGATALEYGLVLALVTLVVLVGVINVANATTEKWNGVAAKVVRS